jgi:hypothetical protein
MSPLRVKNKKPLEDRRAYPLRRANACSAEPSIGKEGRMMVMRHKRVHIHRTQLYHRPLGTSMEDVHNCAAPVRRQLWAICHTRLLDAALYGRYNHFQISVFK